VGQAQPSFYAAPLPPSLPAKSKIRKIFLSFFQNPARPQKRKRVEKFSVFEASRRLVQKPV
jgi:hypothetical protein